MTELSGGQRTKGIQRSHDAAHTGAVGNGRRILGEQPQKLRDKSIDKPTGNQPEHGAEPQADAHPLPGPPGIPRPQILGDEGGGGDGEANDIQ